MKPVCIEIENLRSFRARRKIEFPADGFFAILGDTGAGKTSILEAVTYALFNRPTWDGRNVKALIAKEARTMSVAFTFTVDDDEFTMTRITRQNGAPTQRFVCAARGIDEARGDGVQAAVEDALQMDAETFLHTVLLPQGKHAELLTKDPGKRNDILADIFQLDDVEKVDGLAQILKARAESGLTLLRSQRDKCGADPQGRVGEAGAMLEGARAALVAADQALGEVRAIDLNRQMIDREQEMIQLQMQALRPGDGAMEALRRVVIREESLGREEDVQRKLLDGTKKDAAGARAILEALVKDGSDATRLRKVQRDLDAYAAESRGLEADVGDLAGTSEELTAILKQHARAKRKATEAKSAADAAQMTFREAQNDVASRRSGLETLKRAIADVDVAQATVERCKADAARDDAGLIRLQIAAETAAEDLAKERETAEKMRAAVEAAELANRAAALATHLHTGDDCPVCRRPLPKTFTPPAVPKLAAAQQAAKEANTRLSTCETTKHRLDVEIAGVRRAADIASQHLSRVRKDCEHAQAELAKWTGAKTAETALTGLEQEIAQRERGLLPLNSAAQLAATVAQEAREKYGVLEGRRGELEHRHGELVKSVERRRGAIEKKAQALPAAFVPGDEIDVTTLHVRLAEALAHAEKAEAHVANAERAASEATTALASIIARLADEVVTPRATLVARLGPVAAALDSATAPESGDHWRDWVTSTLKAAAERLTRYNRRLAEVVNAREEAETARAAVLVQLGGEPEEVKNLALVSRANAEAELRAAQANVEAELELKSKIVRLEPATSGLATLRSTLRAPAFPAYATAQRQRRLLEIASVILGEMVDGRYGFTPEFAIFDRHTNEERIAQTLSGGEKFLASLALSLAVVEIAASAGAKIESLFLDEGFDSLDATMLPIAMLELRKYARKGRSIGVITHVREAAQFVSETYMVRETGDGSMVERINGPIDQDEAEVEGLVSQLMGI